jgi:hypothetical protein
LTPLYSFRNPTRVDQKRARIENRPLSSFASEG